MVTGGATAWSPINIIRVGMKMKSESASFSALTYRIHSGETPCGTSKQKLRILDRSYLREKYSRACAFM